MQELRQTIIDRVTKTWNIIDPTKKNGEKFAASINSMNDEQFIDFMEGFVNNPKQHLYLELEAFDNEPTYEMIEKAADDLGKYVTLYDYLAIPHISEDPDKPEYTVHKVFNGPINMRRVQQLVNKKNHIPTDINTRNPKTGQVTGESKAARVSDMEQFALICHGTTEILKEMFGPKSGDPVMKEEMAHQIATTGSASMANMENSPLNKVALNTANVILLGAGLETDMVTKGGILPRTLKNQYDEAKKLDRSKT